MVILRVLKKDFDLIAAGTKKTEWRSVSHYNKKLLLKINDKGLYDRNEDIKEIKFVNGYRSDAPALLAEIHFIRLDRFINDVDIPADDFHALAGQVAIEISLGKITVL